MEHRRLKMGDIEEDVVCYEKKDGSCGLVAHRLRRRDGNPQFSLDELRHLVKCWNILAKFSPELFDEIAEDNSRLLLTEKAPHDALLAAMEKIGKVIEDCYAGKFPYACIAARVQEITRQFSEA